MADGGATADRISSLIEAWRADEDRAASVSHVEVLPARPPAVADLALHPDVEKRLVNKGVGQLYHHQIEAIERLRRGEHVAVVAGTASGKSLAYQIPIAETVADDPSATAIVLYPTKALAADQLRGFLDVAGDELVAATYDGDTPSDQRAWVRRNASVLLTNPDMLHVGVLPNHERWRSFLSNLRYVVVDEMHAFKGIFGTHLGLVLRRLRRVAALCGAAPQFVFTSATIGNPGELAAALSALDVAVVDRDTSGSGEKHIVIWNPPMEDEAKGLRGSPLTEGSRLMADLVGHGLNTIVFSRSRKSSELMYRWTLDRLPQDLRSKIAPYRAGYLTQQRRETEERLASGELVGVVATNALELGIDVGGLDAAVLTTFPGTIASFRQQSGRSGRRRDASLAVLVAGQDALDQYYVRHPDELFGRTAESAVVNPSNPELLAAHLACAAFEQPLTPADATFFGHEMEEVVAAMVADDQLGIRSGRLFHSGGGSPARSIDLRSVGGLPFRILTQAGVELGSVDRGRAFSQCHPGAVYLHHGASYVVEGIDLDSSEVHVRREEPGYYTQPKTDKDMAVLSVAARRTMGPLEVLHGRVEVSSEVIAYQRKSIATGQTLGTHGVDLPRQSYTTQAVWWRFPEALFAQASVSARDVPGTLHAAEHTAIAMMPVQAVCDRWDIGGLSSAHHPAFDGPGFFIYDGYPGGAGISPIAFDRAEELFAVTLETLRTCPCAQGCPSCVQSPKCGNFNDPLDKAGARRVLELVMADVWRNG